VADKRPIHTVPHGDGWANRREGNQRVTEVFDTQREAQAAGRDVARRDGTEHLTHGRNGQIRERNSYGNDPHPPAG
jgi:hypothetical protein